MTVEVNEEPITFLEEYGRIPIAFEVNSVFDLEESGSRPDFVLTERQLKVSYTKDYDAIEGERPSQWSRRFSTANWGVFAARLQGQLVGGAVVAFNTPGMGMLADRKDLAVLWDIRVAPEARGKGIGSALFNAAENWARSKGCRTIKVETQNINVAACRFYRRQGAILTEVNRNAYTQLPDEIQLVWYKDL
jgi:GNAT superfamily N-acetyltransferase